MNVLIENMETCQPQAGVTMEEIFRSFSNFQIATFSN